MSTRWEQHLADSNAELRAEVVRLRRQLREARERGDNWKFKALEARATVDARHAHLHGQIALLRGKVQQQRRRADVWKARALARTRELV